MELNVLPMIFLVDGSCESRAIPNVVSAGSNNHGELYFVGIIRTSTM
jgi:hypothetical protein